MEIFNKIEKSCYNCKYSKKVYFDIIKFYFLCNYPEYVFKYPDQEDRFFINIYYSKCNGKYWKEKNV